MTPDLAMILVRLLAEAHTKLAAWVPESTALGHLTKRAAKHPGALIRELRDVLRRTGLEWDLMRSTEPTRELAAAMHERIPLLRAVKDFVGHVPRTPLTEPIVSAIVTTIANEAGDPVTAPLWCPVTQGDLARACRVTGHDGVVLQWVFLTLAGWYAVTDPGGPMKVDVQAMLDGAMKASRFERKEAPALAALADKISEGMTWIYRNPVSVLALLNARTWDDIDTAASAAGGGN